jgi:hypothetical protein
VGDYSSEYHFVLVQFKVVHNEKVVSPEVEKLLVVVVEID